jgi:Ca2+-transporting ATPase
VASLFLLILSNRDLSRTAIIVANNPWIKRMFAGVILLLGTVMAVPYLRGIMGFAPTTTEQLIASMAMLIGVGLWFEAVRRVGARLPARPLEGHT